MIRIKFDTSAFVAATRVFAKALPSQFAQSINTSARAARTAFLAEARAEIGAKRGAVTKGVGAELVRASPATLTAIFKPSTKSGRFRDVGITFTAKKATGLTAATHVVTKGSKTFKRGFIFKGKAVSRIGTGRYNFKSLRMTTAAAIMSQEDEPARQTWERVAVTTLEATLPDAVNKAAAKAGFG